ERARRAYVWHCRCELRGACCVLPATTPLPPSSTDRDDGLSARVTGCKGTDRGRHLAQRIAAIDDRRERPRFQHLLEDAKVLLVHERERRPELLSGRDPDD